MAQEVLTKGLLELSGEAGTLWLRDHAEVSAGEANLSLMDRSGSKRWDAAEVHALDKWTAISLVEGRLFANSGGGFLCELSIEDGSTVSTTFVK